MQLTVSERLLLRNQLSIMKALAIPMASPKQYDELIEIVESGYELYYPDVAMGVQAPGASSAVTAETLEILDMFRALDAARQAGLKVSGGTGHASFAGFDGNNDPHYGFAGFLLDVRGYYAESAPSKNSHSSMTISTYRRMVSVWQSLGRGHSLSQADVDAILK